MRILWLVLAVRGGVAAAQKPASRNCRRTIPMRDGVKLAANVFLPSGEHGRLPVILERTPYGKGVEITPNHQAFVDHGYAVVVQDVRGRYESRGHFRSAAAGGSRRRRYAQLDRAAAVVGRQDRDDRRAPIAGSCSGRRRCSTIPT